MKRALLTKRIFVVIAILFMATDTLYANAGIGLFAPGALVFIGNIFIGLIEAFFVRKVFKVTVSSGRIILGNYASWFIGYVFVAILFPEDFGFYTPEFGAKILPILFIVSVFIEWPFFVKAMKEGTLGYSKTSLKYTFYAQCISYLLLIPLYLSIDERGGGYSAESSAKDAITADLANLAATAFQYRIKPTNLGGGNGTYTGYKIPKGFGDNANAIYTSSNLSNAGVDTAIVFTGTSKAYTGQSITDTVFSNGKISNLDLTHWNPQ